APGFDGSLASANIFMCSGALASATDRSRSPAILCDDWTLTKRSRQSKRDDGSRDLGEVRGQESGHGFAVATAGATVTAVATAKPCPGHRRVGGQRKQSTIVDVEDALREERERKNR